MHEISTCSALHLPLIIVASITFGISFFTESLVSLHNFGVLRFRRSSIGEPTFNVNICGGIPHTYI